MVATLFILAGIAWGQAEAPASKASAPTAEPQSKQALAERVKKLIVQLDDDSQARRDAAEKALIEIGPDLLELLPPAGPKSSIELRARLGRVRSTLEKAHIEAFTKPSTVSLQGKMKLSQAIASIEKQTGNTLIDARERFNQEVDNPDMHLEVEKASFWEVLDGLLDEAGLTLYGYGDTPGELLLMAANPGDAPRSDRGAYSGLFRVEVKSLEATRDLRNVAGNGLRIATEIAWEPRVRPIVLELPLSSLKAEDENGEEITSSGDGDLEVPIEGGASVVDMDLYLSLPKRAIKKIAKLSGTFTALVPGRAETFEFSKLDKAMNESLERGGAMVTLEQVRKNDDVTEVRLRIKFDEASNALESHRGWIDENEAYLLDPKGNKIEQAGRERNRVAENEVGYSYLFDPGEAPIGQCRFVYKTPAALFKVDVPFELKDLELP